MLGIFILLILSLVAYKFSKSREVEYLSSERGVEAEMRRQFDIVREGEQVVIILDDDKSTTTPTTTLPAEEESRPWYKFW